MNTFPWCFERSQYIEKLPRESTDREQPKNRQLRIIALDMKMQMHNELRSRKNKIERYISACETLYLGSVGTNHHNYNWRSSCEEKIHPEGNKESANTPWV